MLLTEDKLVDWIDSKKGLLITRSKLNEKNYDFSKIKTIQYACITGYTSIIEHFFLNLIHYFNKGVILIIIESDMVRLTKNMLNHINLLHCFTWNKPFSHNKLTSLPIGLNYNRQYKVLENWLLTPRENNNKKLLCMNCSLHTDPTRKDLQEYAKVYWSDFCDMLDFIHPSFFYVIPSFIEGQLNINVTNSKCYDGWNNYCFVLSPQGAGLDCHRTWEAIAIGIIPIILSSSIDEMFENLPVLIVDSWSVISKEFLQTQYEVIQQKRLNNEYNMEKINLDYWTNQIEKTRKTKKNNIHFITYGNHVFEKAKERISKEANDFGVFSSISTLGPDDLPIEFREKFSNILTLPRIAGCGIWRPMIILNKLKKMNDGEFLLYLDAGCTLNINAKKRFYNYLDLFSNNDMGIMTIQMTGNNFGTLCKENQYTRKEIFEYFNIDPNSNIGNSAQCLSGVLLMRKNKHLMNIIKLWLKAVYDNVFMFTDLELSKQHIEFIANRHEQSVLSILTKIHKSIVIDGDESWTIPFGKGISMNYPFWATRKKD